MRWDAVMSAVVAALRADSALVTALGAGTAIRRAAHGAAVTVPSVTWLLVTDTKAETTNPLLVQFDIFAADDASAITIETRLRALLDFDLPATFGAIQMWAEMMDGRDLPTPAELDPGILHRQLDFRFTPLRAKYAAIT